MADVAPQVQGDFDLNEGSFVEVDIVDREETQVSPILSRACRIADCPTSFVEVDNVDREENQVGQGVSLSKCGLPDNFVGDVLSHS